MVTTTIKPPVLDVLRRCIPNGNTLVVPRQANGDFLDRKLYEDTNKVLELLGGKWKRQANAHVFEGDAAERIADAITSGQVTDAKKLHQFYETPAHIARELVIAADIDPSHTVLEPSAGSGAIVRELFTKVDVYELEPVRAAVLKKMFDVRLLGHDFLAAKPPKVKYDRIVANPPFSKSQDIIHVEHMYEFLAPGGTLVTLTSPGWTYRNDVRHAGFRSFMETNGHHSEQLPAGSFRESGTDVTVMLCVIKKER